jgi:hypothetical protein
MDRNEIDRDESELRRLFDESAAVPERATLVRLAAGAADIPTERRASWQSWLLVPLTALAVGVTVLYLEPWPTEHDGLALATAEHAPAAESLAAVQSSAKPGGAGPAASAPVDEAFPEAEIGPILASLNADFGAYENEDYLGLDVLSDVPAGAELEAWFVAAGEVLGGGP